MATLKQFLNIINGELGVAIGDPDKPYAVENSCALFTAWVYRQADMDHEDGSSPAWQQGFFEHHGRFVTSHPQLGDQIFVDLDGTSSGTETTHTGFVVGINPDGTVTTVEFNNPDGGPNTVKTHIRRAEKDDYVVGFGHNEFSEVPTFHEELFLQDPMQHNNDVETWQQQMSDRGWAIDVDGWFGSQSDSVCRQFQSEKGLEVDGVVGPMTWDATWTSPVT